MNTLFQKLKPLFAALLIFAVGGQLLLHSIIANVQAQEATLAQAALRCTGLNLTPPSIGGIAEGLDPTKVPVRDTATKDELRKKSCEDFKDRALDLLTKILREILKKRILDAMVDQTIHWIQGGGSPKFVTDFGGVLEDAGQAAVGDVAREVGMGKLCTGISPARIRFQLETPVFSQRISCTLDDVVGNIKRFGRNFTSGGFIGYQELLRPQNNRWGVEILTLNELEKRTAQKQDILRQEVAAGSGFLSTKRCLEWTLFADFGGRVEQLDTVAVNDNFNYPDPSQSPPVLDNTQTWECTKQQLSTPGRLIADTTVNALNLHSNFIVNAEDLSGYAAAIIDAGINRVIKEGFKGVLGVPVSAPPTGFASTNLPPSVTETASGYTDAQQEQGGAPPNQQDLSQVLDGAEQALRNASSTYRTALQVNNFARSTTASLIDWCRIVEFIGGSNISQHPQSCSTASRIWNDAQANETLFEQNIESIGQELPVLASLRTTIQTFPTDLNELALLVEQIAQFAQKAAQWETAAANQRSTAQRTLEQMDRLYLACTDNDEITQCP